MKNLFQLFLIFFISFSLTSCQKEKLSNNFENLPTVSVSTKGFLIFPNAQSLIQFTQEISNSNNSLAKLKAKGFRNRENAQNSFKNSLSSAYATIFNEDGFLQINDVILKLSNDKKFLYIVKEKFANAETYNKLSGEIYDPSRMNRINVDRNLSTNFNFEAFIKQNPNGVYEKLYVGAQKRPMFGSTTVTYPRIDPPFFNVYGQCQECTHTYSQTTTYIFWIGFPEEPEYQSTICVAATGC